MSATWQDQKYTVTCPTCSIERVVSRVQYWKISKGLRKECKSCSVTGRKYPNRPKVGSIHYKNDLASSLHKTRFYGCWVDMKTRCTNKNSESYPNYGGRGITVCDRWLSSFVNFVEDMYPTYADNLTLNRKDNDGNYDPGNCEWASRKAQMRNYRRNRKLTYAGRTQTVIEWAEELGIKSTTIRQRLDYYGWSVDAALTKKN